MINDYFYCINCKRIPEIIIRNDSVVKIKCVCGKRNYGISEDKSLETNAKELTYYNYYLLFLEKYFSIIQENRKEKRREI